MDTVFGVILLIASVFLVVAVLMQSGKSHNLSGSIAGGAETFFGKTKGKAIDKMLSKVTTVVAIVFVLLTIIVYVIQPNEYLDTDKWFNENFQSESVNNVDAETTAAEIDEASDEDIFEQESDEDEVLIDQE